MSQIKFNGFITAVLLFVQLQVATADENPASNSEKTPNQNFVLVQASHATPILVDSADYAVVKLAAGMFADDVSRITGKRPFVSQSDVKGDQVIVVGTIGHSALIDQLVAAGKLKPFNRLKGAWETTLLQLVENPWPGVKRAYVVAGSDRRGTAYGLMELSQRIGVSPWYWWADVPVPKRDTLTLASAGPEVLAPAVKYRGIFINDEDWGLKPWAEKTFDPQFKNIGPKTYEKVFELMLRLKLNYLWPAMHPCSAEFASQPENSALADRYAIVMGSSHCEPMLQNNVWWPHDKGEWRYDTNRKNILDYWEDSVKARGNYEAVWTLGIRGIHDGPMQGPPDIHDRVALVGQVIHDQQQLIQQGVSQQWGPVAECFIPYKEVQPIYNAGLEVPPNVTLVWADDNYGYLRRLGNLTEQQRPGGSGFYYHISYVGNPQSYSWINTTPPALMWEEMTKAWYNHARTLWILNVGDIKPGELGIDFFARLAWNPAGMDGNAQPHFLRSFAERNFGGEFAGAIAGFCSEYYRLGQIRKPECMTQRWVDSLPPETIAALDKDYHQLLAQEKALAATLPAESQDAWNEMIGYPARMLAASGLIFIEDGRARKEANADKTHAESIVKWRAYINQQTDEFNEKVAGGKWRYMMPSGDDEGAEPWYVSMIWPWVTNEKVTKRDKLEAPMPLILGRAIAAADCNRKRNQPGALWTEIAGLGRSGRALTIEPASLPNTNDSTAEKTNAPELEYDFENKSAGCQVVLNFLPTYRLFPGLKLRVSVGIDNLPSQVTEVPGSDLEDETGPIRRDAVRNNRVSLPLSFPNLVAGRHTLKIQAVDPGLVLDEIYLP